MGEMLAFSKPKDQKQVPVSVYVYPDGREMCNFLTVAGRQSYRDRVTEMLERQRDVCCLSAYAPMCPGRLLRREATFEHEGGRGSGGGKRDDRTALPDGTWINGAAHWACNNWKGSRYIDYNREFQRG